MIEKGETEYILNEHGETKDFSDFNGKKLVVKTRSNYLEIHFGSQIESLSSYFFSHPCTSNSNSYCTYQMMEKIIIICIVDKESYPIICFFYRFIVVNV